MDGTGTTRPRPLGHETDHYWLVKRMAKATGVDLVRAVEEGVLSHADWAGIVTRCRGCTWAGGCGHWLDAPVEDTRAIPGSCLNRNRLADLRDKMAPSAP